MKTGMEYPYNCYEIYIKIKSAQGADNLPAGSTTAASERLIHPNHF